MLIAALFLLQDPQDPLEEHVRLYERAAPAVVCVSTNGRNWQTGVIITEDGYVLTYNPRRSNSRTWTASMNRFMVRFADGHDVEGHVVARDQNVGWLLARLPAGTAYPHLELADSSPLRLGDVVYTFGDSWQSLSSDGHVAISLGVVSDRYELEGVGEVLETSAAVNPGQDGSPLVTPAGEVAGLVTLDSYHPSRYAGVVVPSTRYLEAVREAIRRDRTPAIAQREGEVWLGWELDSSDDAAIVRLVYAEGPAVRAGVQAGDRIVDVRRGDQVASDLAAMRNLLASATTEDELVVRIRRGDQELTLRLRPEEVVFY